MQTAIRTSLALLLSLALGPVALSPLALSRKSGAEPGELSVLSYNTHGLAAWVARDDPERRFPAIGELANGYDVVLLQEDFAHHERLRLGTRHPTVRRGNPSLKPWCPICSGSGLTFLSRWRALEALVNGTYGGCSGWLLGANDCLADKGFQIAELRLPGGVAVHFANTHLDAGMGDHDRQVRGRQLEELAAAIGREVGPGPLVVGGDFNLDAADPRDRALLASFSADLGLRDSGARARPGSPWLVLDYLFFRSGEDVELRVVEAGEDPDFVLRDAPLSDHPAIFARFLVEAGEAREVSGSSTPRRPPE